MEQFPSNSKRPQRPREEPKKIERVVQGEVVRRKTPIGRRLSKHLFNEDPRGVWGFVMDEVVIPGARAMFSEAFHGGFDRMFYGDSRGSGRHRGRGGPVGHVQYDRYARGGRPRDDTRRDISPRGRANHAFDEIILKTRVEAEAVLDQLEDLTDRYDAATVADLYQLVGITSAYTDGQWGWTDVRGSSVTRVRDGYLLNLPRPIKVD